MTKNNTKIQQNSNFFEVVWMILISSPLLLFIYTIMAVFTTLSNAYDEVGHYVFLNAAEQVSSALSEARYKNVEFEKITDLKNIYFEKIPLITSEKNKVYFEKSEYDQYSYFMKLKANEIFCTNLSMHSKPNADFGCNYESGDIIAYYHLK